MPSLSLSLSLPSLPFTLLLVPVLFLLALPLVPFAIGTTFFAAGCLLLRAFFIYAEMAGTLLRQLLRPESTAPSHAVSEYTPRPGSSPRSSSLSSGSRPSQHPIYSFSSSGSLTSRRPSASSQHNRANSSSGLMSPPIPAAGGNVSAPQSVYGGISGNGSANGSGVRDYEGVGGWRDVLGGDAEHPDDDDDDYTWTTLNRRLELPISSSNSMINGNSGNNNGHRPAHRRSLTSGSLRLGLDRGLSALSLRGLRNRDKDVGNNDDGGPPSRPRSLHGGNGEQGQAGAGRLSGRASPDDAGLTMKARSLVDGSFGGIKHKSGGSAAGRERRKSGSRSGSMSSGNSHRTMTATTGNGWMAP